MTLSAAVLQRTVQDGSLTRYPQSHYLDFVVDARPLKEILGVGPGVVTPLNRAWLPTVAESIEELLGERPTVGLESGRTSLLVCGDCGDLACGAVTASLRADSDIVRWGDFAWENGYEAATSLEDAPESITFARDPYRVALAGAHERVAELPYDQLAHEGRKLLWPWQWGWRLPKV